MVVISERLFLAQSGYRFHVVEYVRFGFDVGADVKRVCVETRTASS